MLGRQGTDIVRFSVVIPGNNFHESRTESQNLIPAIVPKSIGWEDPILILVRAIILDAQDGKYL